jgi:hypothetical protein
MGTRRLLRFMGKYTAAAFSCAFTLTIGLFFPKYRARLSNLCALSGYCPKLVPPVIPKVTLGKILNDGTPVSIREPIDSNGNITLLELVVIAKLIVRYKPLRLFEIGTFDGRTTLNMAANSPEGAAVYTLDLPREKINATALALSGKHSPDDKLFIDKDSSGSRFIGSDCQSKITQLYGDSAAFYFGPFLNTMDFVFIDGAHSYDYVKNDSAIALKLLKEGKGTVVWHDYDSVWEGVTKALNELFNTAPAYVQTRHISGTSLVYLQLS